jgi:hypothetical protein
MHFLDGLGHVGSALLKPFWYWYTATKDRLRIWGDVLARTALTASVVRGSRIRLSWWEWPIAWVLQRQGHGSIHNGFYEVWVNVTPPGVLLAMQARGQFSPQHNWEWWDY